MTPTESPFRAGPALEDYPGTGVATLCEAFQRAAALDPGKIALRLFRGRADRTWQEYADEVRRTAAGLAALGVSRGDTVAMLARNIPEACILDAAVLHLGATPFSIYSTSSADQIEYVFSNAENRIAAYEAEFAPLVRSASAPLVEHHITLTGEAGPGSISLGDLQAAGDPEFDFEASWRSVTADDVAVLIYTSGTTGPPKGVQLTHGNLVFQMQSIASTLPTAVGGHALSYLPMAHIADRINSYYSALYAGHTITLVPDIRDLLEATLEARPTQWGAMPRTWEKLMASLRGAGVDNPSALTDVERAAVRARIGLENATWLSSGAAPIPAEALDFFGGLGLPICECYGLSETAGVATLNPPHDVRFGTVGPALPGIETKVLDDGELLLRGPTIMVGYRNDPERTAEAVDADGWLHTGDIAEFDPDGYVSIVDRKKELIINSSGKNMSPANIERQLKAASPLIGQACTIGDGRPHITALLVLEAEACAAFAAEHGIADASPAALVGNAAVQAEIKSAVAAANDKLSRVEHIRAYTLLDSEWLPSSEELTPTMKLRRRSIAEKYADRIEAMYSGGNE